MIELFVVMSLVGLIISFAYTVFEFGIQSFEDWRSANELYREASMLGHHFTDDIYKTAEVITCTEEELQLLRTDRTPINYKLNNNGLIRNGHSVLSENLRISDARFVFFKKQTGLFGSGGNTCNELQGIGLKAELRNNDKSWFVDLTITLRQAAEWN